MAALSRGQASNCSNPVLDLFTTVNGVLTDVAELEFVISEKVTIPGTPTQVYPPAGRATVDVANLCPTGHKISTGRYVAEWTPDLTEPIGTHCVQWFFKLTPTSPEQTFTEEFEVLPEVTGSTSTGYCTIADLRDEGVPDESVSGGFSDAFLQTRIARVSRLIDMYTGRFFEPRTLTYNVSGQQSRTLFLDHPIIELTQLSIESVVVELENLIVFNRHIAQNLLSPDDRENPRIELLQPVTGDLLFAIGIKVFPRGQLNIELQGIFGYTDYDGTPTGKTPDLICHAAKLMAMRELHRMYDQADDRASFGRANLIRRLRTRDQEIEYADPAATVGKGGAGVHGVGPFTGDPEIDTILMRYRRPMHIGSSSGGPLPGGYGY